MEVDPQITAIEQRAKDAGVKMASVLRDAGVAATTWWRWREGTVEPKLGTLRKVEAALERRLNPGQQAA
jgi:predicted transcriptional regulator